ncbi:MAG: hypothetical protein GYA55_10255 [SAR324 cluster bacterium]|uniref:Tetratricopeptide repeat protein n=1 Tax=SAR324 cluster bacterium TaxID=2024889 RepID=A0A7X9FST1_9DELT|nr:hypothetical protein [SAR324 cluster bacterium]
MKNLQGTEAERLIVINAGIDIASNEIAAISNNLLSLSTGLCFACSDSQSGRLDITELSTENIVEAIAKDNINPAGIISIPFSILKALPDNQSIKPEALSIYCAISALAIGEEITMLSSSSSDFEPITPKRILSASDMAKLIRFAISEFNIEDLFPNYAWVEHEEESLSLCYHTLAAIFIKIGDWEGATECLNISEQFEDSPRLLALRGIVASKQGRTLEAVANMVSSLQQYESRKKNDGEHYLSFNPSSLEDINVDLKDGLDALNQRDNSKAFECFSNAIFNFDTFYRDLGIC